MNPAVRAFIHALNRSLGARVEAEIAQFEAMGFTIGELAVIVPPPPGEIHVVPKLMIEEAADDDAGSGI